MPTHGQEHFRSCIPPENRQRSIPVLCSSKKQSSTARSTTEAELIACASALFGEVLNLHTMIESLVGIHVQQDNPAAITVMITGYSAKLRHCGRVHRVNVASTHEQLEQGIFTLRYCESHKDHHSVRMAANCRKPK